MKWYMDKGLSQKCHNRSALQETQMFPTIRRHSDQI